MVERYGWGRVFGAVRARAWSPAERLAYALFSPAAPLVFVARRLHSVIRSGRNRFIFVKCLPWFVTLVLAWCVGEFVGNLTVKESYGSDG